MDELHSNCSFVHFKCSHLASKPIPVDVIHIIFGEFVFVGYMVCHCNLVIRVYNQLEH